MSYEILTNKQMANADHITIESGIDGFDLMKNAGKAATKEILKQYNEQHKALILCGPGNNGGDGFIIAVLLQEAGWDVHIKSLKPVTELQGDAAKAAALWIKQIEDFTDDNLENSMIVIDAVFGTGFSGSLKPPVSELFQKIQKAGCPVVAVDIPSGVNGSTGEVSENTLQADITLTFCRKKLGHVLMPGMSQCGSVIVCDIGIPDSSVEKAGHIAIENTPDLWRSYLEKKDKAVNKYDRGHAVILGGPLMTGASRMAAEAAMRAGAGLCTIAGHKDAADVYRSGSANIMYTPWEDYDGFIEVIQDKRRNAVLIGPGAGLDDMAGLRKAVMASCDLEMDKLCVLDADALTAFKDHSLEFYNILHEKCVLTPHEGEFQRVFPDIDTGHKLERCKEAAELSGAVVLLKGADTVIAHPDGRAVININGTTDLATGGSGDVLAGLILGLLAQGVLPFEAACAGAWIHGRAGQILGKGMIATDIPCIIPQILQEIL